ncbi:MAG: methyltransferase domain-containing protein [Candidatus Omnitrophota bacterium]|nr:MAG: methyltransferase domain-containing protein [Candidatus Omnitrophota bacterium]
MTKGSCRKLILGSAGKKHPDAVTLDINPIHSPDVLHDLNKTPWPFRDNQFDSIIAHHVVEHLNDVCSVMNEVHRICSPQGRIYIEVPHHTSWCANDPLHTLRFNYFAFDGFLEGKSTWVTEKKFICLQKEITFHKIFRGIFLHALFNKIPSFYERFCCYIFPAEHFKIWLQPRK